MCYVVLVLGDCKVTDKASDAWSQYEGSSNMKLFQIQMEHAARPSLLCPALVISCVRFHLRGICGLSQRGLHV